MLTKQKDKGDTCRSSCFHCPTKTYVMADGRHASHGGSHTSSKTVMTNHCNLIQIYAVNPKNFS